ncbi:hypothetical protein M422DRAFT_246733 [Sphaerobolus stellatus SS14]|nr:hypothetical protein M422DRAFT_246733 [Sphaerobolus stellatus SS14]
MSFSRSMVLTSGRAHSASPIGPDGAVYCHCKDVPLQILTSTTEANPNRQFYTCYKDRNDTSRCKFFKWADELPQSEPNNMEHSTLQTPIKRNYRAVETTPSTSFRSPEKAGTSSNTPSNGRGKFRPSVGKSIDEDLAGGEPQSKKQKSGPPEPISNFKEPETPSVRRTSLFSSASMTNTQSGNQWQTIEDDPENPFHERVAALREPTATPSPTKLGSPMKSDNLAENLSQAFSQLAPIIDIATPLVERVRKLERQKGAADKSIEFKEKKIKQLQEEIDRLNKANRALEEENQALRAKK